MGVRIGSTFKYYFALQNLYTIVEYILLSFIFFTQFDKIAARTIIAILTTAYLIFAGYRVFCDSGYLKLNYEIVTVESALMIALALSYYVKALSDLLAGLPRFTAKYFAFINAGVLIYFASTFVFSLFGPYLAICPPEIFVKLWYLNFTGNIIYHTLITFAIWKQEI